jgi:hypothetical protein
MPYYLTDDKARDAAAQKKGWTEIAEYVRQVDPFRRPITIHPTNHGRDQVERPEVLDFDMLQTGHSDRYSRPNHVESVVRSVGREPRMPTLVGEVCYEGIQAACHEEVQRYMFWTAILSGAGGFTYGANGIWQVNTRERPYGPSPHGMTWGDTPWDEAMALPGSANLGLARRFLARLEWWRLEPHPEWVAPHWSKDSYTAGYCAGIPGELLLAYFPHMPWERTTVRGLMPGSRYRAVFVNPANHREYPLAPITADADGSWLVQEGATPNGPLRLAFPLYQDWLLLLQRETARG